MIQSSFKTPEGRYVMGLEINKHIDPRHLSLDHHRYNRQGYTLYSDRLDIFVTNRIHTTQVEMAHPAPSSSSSSSSSPSSAARHARQQHQQRQRQQQEEGIFISLNTGESILIYNALTRSEHLEEPLTHLDCSGGRPTCQRLNQCVAEQLRRMEVVVGFHTGDIAVHDATENRNTLYNREKMVDKSEVTAVAWIPSHALGAASVQSPRDPRTPASVGTPPSTPDGDIHRSRQIGAAISSSSSLSGNAMDNSPSAARRNMDKSSLSNCFITCHANGNLYVYNKKYSDEVPLHLGEHNRQHRQFVAPMGGTAGQKDKYFVLKNKNRNCNPILRIQVCNKQINDIRFSPDGMHMALACADGYLRVIDFHSFSLLVKFQSYYGAFTCCCWSPDGRYIVAGGEDDLITMFDFRNRTIIARGEGHQSYVSSVKFDEYHCDSDVYRIVSVGHDCRLLLWEVSRSDIENLEVAEGVDIGGSLKRGNRSVSSTSISSMTRIEVTVPSLSHSQVPTFEPISTARIASEPLLDLVCFQHGYITVDNQHLVRVWVRLSSQQSQPLPLSEGPADHHSQIVVPQSSHDSGDDDDDDIAMLDENDETQERAPHESMTDN